MSRKTAAEWQEEKKKACTMAFQQGFSQGSEAERFNQKAERAQRITETVKAAAELAQANAKLTYALSQILNKV